MKCSKEYGFVSGCNECKENGNCDKIEFELYILEAKEEA